MIDFDRTSELVSDGKRFLCGNTYISACVALTYQHVVSSGDLFMESGKTLCDAVSPTTVWIVLSVIVRMRMCDKLVLYQRESMEKDMFTIRNLKACWLRIIRTARGLQQAELADQAEISIRTLQSYEEGTRSVNKMNLETAYRLAKALNVPIEDLVDPRKKYTLKNRGNYGLAERFLVKRCKKALFESDERNNIWGKALMIWKQYFD